MNKIEALPDNQNESSNSTNESKKKRLGGATKWLGYGLFWSWNSIFVVVAVFLILPYIALPLMKDVAIGAAPVDQAVMALLVVALPFASIALALIWFRRTQPRVLLALFYGVEMPILFVVISRIVLLRDMNPGLVHLFVSLLIAFSAYLLLLILMTNKFESAIKSNSIGLLHSRLALATVVLVTGGYLAGLLLPFALPVLALLLNGLWETEWLKLLSYLVKEPIIIFAFLLFAYTASLFVLLPFIMVFLYLKRFFVAWRSVIQQYGYPKASVLVVAILSIQIVLFNWLNYQSQPMVLGQLEALGQHSLDEPTKQLILQDKEEIRKALVNAYLGAYRYVSTEKESRLVLGAYDQAFNKTGWLAEQSQGLFNALAKPFLYKGEGFWQDRKQATYLYQYLFDTPIEKAEKAEILSAMNATWEREQMAAGLVNALSRYVHLAKLAIDIKIENGLATVNVVQHLQNQTFQNHEVVMHFSLPEDAVLSALWISDDEQNPRKYPAVVAPRGAAQQVYRDEVTRRVDPSILEKVGPRQYRLKAFPVLAKQRDFKDRYSVFNFNEPTQADPFIVEFEYVSPLVEPDQLLPNLLESRNLFWDSNTAVTVNNENAELSENWMPDLNNWFDDSQLESVTTQEFRGVVGKNIIVAEPKDKSPLAADLSKFKVGILIDSSFSMDKLREEVKQSLNWLTNSKADFTVFYCVSVDLMKSNGGHCEQSAQKIDQVPFFGNLQPMQQLKEWVNKEKGSVENYDALIMLTDEGSYELAEDTETSLDLRIPLWLVHLGNYPYAYPDGLLELLKQSRGGATTSVEHVFDQLVNAEKLDFNSVPKEKRQLIAVGKDFNWFVEPKSPTNDIESQETFNKVAALKWLDYLAVNFDSSSDDRLNQLDQLHQIALEYSLVSDYSSMIALVNDRQKQALKDASSRSDRFEREIETGAEELTTPTDVFSVSAVPEPEEWILIGLVIIMLGWVYFNKRAQLNQSSIGLKA